MKPDEVQEYVNRLTDLARQLNTFAGSLKTIRAEHKPKSVREDQGEYLTISLEDIPFPLFSEEEFNWLTS
jgi:hypothetical protein